MLSALITLVVVLLVFTLLVAVHELGHMIAAKLVGVKVERFSVGFGPPIWERRWGDTVYQLAPIPIGGYVKVHGMLPEEKPTPHSFKVKPWWQRGFIIIMGPIFNLLLAVAMIFAMGLVGVPQFGLFVREVDSQSPAQAAGIQPGDMIVEVEGDKITDFSLFQHKVQQAGARDEAVELGVLRDGEEITLRVKPRFDPDYQRYLMGIRLEFAELAEPVISTVFPGYWADQSGFRIGDRVLAIDGQPVRYEHEVVDAVIQLPDEEPRVLTFTIEREGKILTLQAPTLPVDQYYKLGFQMRPILTRVPFKEAMVHSWQRTKGMAIRIVEGLGMLGKGLVDRSTDPGVVGIVGIVYLIHQTAQTSFYNLMFLIVIISVNLGILNLLPIPALDGGRLVFILLDGFLSIFGMRVNERLETLVHTIGFLLIVTLLVVILTWFDLFRIFGKPKVPLAPPASTSTTKQGP